MWEELRQNVGTLPAWGVNECRLAAYVLRVEPCFSAESKSGWIRAIVLTELFITAGAIAREPKKSASRVAMGNPVWGTGKNATRPAARESPKNCVAAAAVNFVRPSCSGDQAVPDPGTVGQKPPRQNSKRCRSVDDLDGLAAEPRQAGYSGAGE
jgi:hypothetical protein